MWFTQLWKDCVGGGYLTNANNNNNNSNKLAYNNEYISINEQDDQRDDETHLYLPQENIYI